MQKYINNNEKCIKRKIETKLKEKKGCSIHKWKSGAKKDADLDTSFLIFPYIIYYTYIVSSIFKKRSL